jgi:hypothetical protein
MMIMRKKRDTEDDALVSVDASVLMCAVPNHLRQWCFRPRSSSFRPLSCHGETPAIGHRYSVTNPGRCRYSQTCNDSSSSCRTAAYTRCHACGN